MRFIAIARLKVGEYDGFRILDVLSKEFKDVSYESVERVLSDKKNTVENLCVDNGIIKGTNGSVDRLTYIKDGRVIGDSSIIIIDKVGTGYYNISDYKGLIEQVSVDKLLELSDKYTIANGRVVNKGDKKYISAISGKFNEIGNDVVVTKDNNKEKGLYVGEYIGDCDIKSYITTNRLNKHNIYYLKENKVNIDTMNWSAFYSSRDNMRRGEINKINGYGAIGYIIYRCDEKDINKLLTRVDVVNKIERIIETFNSKYNGRASIDSSTGIGIPNSRMKYGDLLVDESIEEDVVYKDMTDDEIKKINDKLAIMGSRLIFRIKMADKDKKVALVRECKKSGIKYKVIGKAWNNADAGVRNYDIEKILENYSEFVNVVKIDDNIYDIKGLDGVYRYDLEKIYESYNSNKVVTRKAKKASIIGSKYTEVLNARGELEKISSDTETLLIPKEAKDIKKKAININKNNRVITIGDNVVKCSKECIDRESILSNLEIVNIECNKSSSLNFIQALIRKLQNTIVGKDIKINFSRNISLEELYELARYSAGVKRVGKDDLWLIGSIKGIDMSDKDKDRFNKYMIKRSNIDRLHKVIREKEIVLEEHGFIFRKDREELYTARGYVESFIKELSRCIYRIVDWHYDDDLKNILSDILNKVEYEFEEAKMDLEWFK